MNTLSQHTISIQGYELTYTLERKMVKNINLRIRRDLSIYVSAHPGVPFFQIEAFLQKQGSFILKSLEEYKHRATVPFLTLRDGDSLFLAGKPYVLTVRPGLHNTIYCRKDTVYMEVSDTSWQQRRSLYHALLRQKGTALFEDSAERIFPQLSAYGIVMPKLRQRIMRSRWGSCMPAKAIVTMNTYLAIMPEGIIDHVMLHELCHLIHPNHSRHFYNVMTMIMPDWKARRAAMMQYVPFCV